MYTSIRDGNLDVMQGLVELIAYDVGPIMSV